MTKLCGTVTGRTEVGGETEEDAHGEGRFRDGLNDVVVVDSFGCMFKSDPYG